MEAGGQDPSRLLSLPSPQRLGGRAGGQSPHGTASPVRVPGVLRIPASVPLQQVHRFRPSRPRAKPRPRPSPHGGSVRAHPRHGGPRHQHPPAPARPDPSRPQLRARGGQGRQGAPPSQGTATRARAPRPTPPRPAPSPLLPPSGKRHQRPASAGLLVPPPPTATAPTEAPPGRPPRPTGAETKGRGAAPAFFAPRTPRARPLKFPGGAPRTSSSTQSLSGSPVREVTSSPGRPVPPAASRHLGNTSGSSSVSSKLYEGREGSGAGSPARAAQLEPPAPARPGPVAAAAASPRSGFAPNPGAYGQRRPQPPRRAAPLKASAPPPWPRHRPAWSPLPRRPPSGGKGAEGPGRAGSGGRWG
ncbi:basic salivary proline-rich protein 3-like [Lathamus discolor]|uniref:basic salivary proline-rich protein 3-like n=1 Tax=Lathamus discolor TaxID=678569 RepID=UPI0032B8280B